MHTHDQRQESKLLVELGWLFARAQKTQGTEDTEDTGHRRHRRRRGQPEQPALHPEDKSEGATRAGESAAEGSNTVTAAHLQFWCIRLS